MSVFSTLKGYILCREKGHMSFFHNSWSTVGVASKIKKKKTCDHNDSLSNGSLKTKQNTIFMLFWGSITQQQVFLHVNLFWLKCYTITVDMILIHWKKNFARVWALIGPKEGSEPNISIICLPTPRLEKNFVEK